jgi:polysaccharide pyruvyl transferase WcaK-like protein
MVNIHLIGVLGANQGEMAILKTELSEFKALNRALKVSISVVDFEGFKKRLGSHESSLTTVQPLVYTPFELADLDVKHGKYSRQTPMYKLFTLMYSFHFFLQILLVMVSVILLKAHIRPFYRRGVLVLIKKADLVVVNGGENLKEGFGFLPYDRLAGKNSRTLVFHRIFWWLELLGMLFHIVIVKRAFKKPIIVLPNTVGPIETVLGSFMIKRAISNVDFVFVRDSNSHRLLRRISPNTPCLHVADIALLMEKSSDESRSQTYKTIVGVSPAILGFSYTIRDIEHYVVAHARVLDYLVKEYDADIVFLPSSVRGFEYDDLEVSKAIVQHMINKNRVEIIGVGSIDRYSLAISKLTLLISTRMHPTILASINHVPFLAIIHDSKQVGFLEKVGLMDCALTIQALLEDDSDERLIAKIKYVLKNREAIGDQLASMIPKLQTQTREKLSEVLREALSPREPRIARYVPSTDPNHMINR